MIYIIENERIGLRKLTTDDVNAEYVAWLNNDSINKFLECRHCNHTEETTKDYIEEVTKNSKEILMGIYYKADNKHIGNIKLGPIDLIHRHATLGLLIGNKEFWGKGIGTDSIKLATKYAIEQLDLVTITAGCYETNIGSQKAFIKAEYSISGKIRSYWKSNKDNNKRVSQILFEYIKQEKIKFPRHGGITIIGGGELMCKIAKYCITLCPVLIIVANRHYDEEECKSLKASGCEYEKVENINENAEIQDKISSYNRCCICFGPAWIFNKKIVDLFESRIVNFNGIPIPKYLGGAHYTWQILNESREGGLFIQQITMNIDRGPILESEIYELPSCAKLPIDYEKFNINRAFDFLITFIDNVNQGKTFFLKNNEIEWTKKEYFPRLLTNKNGWIDWSWSGENIEKFCNSFDEPYPGAHTQLNGNNTIMLKGVSFIKTKGYHPFCSGLVINITEDKYLEIATNSGILRVTDWSIKDIKTIVPRLGDRLMTPYEFLENAKYRIKFGSNGPIENG